MRRLRCAGSSRYFLESALALFVWEGVHGEGRMIPDKRTRTGMRFRVHLATPADSVAEA